MRWMRNAHGSFKKFGLEFAEEITRKLKFNRFQKDESETFDFLGFTLKRVQELQLENVYKDALLLQGRGFQKYTKGWNTT